MKNKLTIACDVDDVSLDLMNHWIDKYNQDYKDDKTIRDITEWDFVKFLKPECGIKIYDYLSDLSLYEAVNPIKGALKGINKLKKMGHRVIYVTAGMNISKYKRLKKLGFLDKEEDYIEARDKSLIIADVLIDDRDFNLFQFTGKYKILFKRPWSRPNDKFKNVTSWKEITEFIENITTTVTCPKCNSECYDNRWLKIKKSSPDFKCKNKECGVAGWFDKNNIIKFKE